MALNQQIMVVEPSDAVEAVWTDFGKLHLYPHPSPVLKYLRPARTSALRTCCRRIRFHRWTLVGLWLSARLGSGDRSHRVGPQIAARLERYHRYSFNPLLFLPLASLVSYQIEGGLSENCILLLYPFQDSIAHLGEVPDFVHGYASS